MHIDGIIVGLLCAFTALVVPVLARIREDKLETSSTDTDKVQRGSS